MATQAWPPPAAIQVSICCEAGLTVMAEGTDRVGAGAPSPLSGAGMMPPAGLELL